MDLPPPPNPNSLPPVDQSSAFNSIFGSKPPAAATSSDTLSQINSIGRRVRMMEEAVMNVRRKIEIQEEDALKTNKTTHTNIQTLFGEVDDLKHQLKSFKDDMVKIIKELQGTVKKEEFIALQKYVEMWQPIHFVTQREVESIVDHVLDMRLSDKKLVDQLIESKIDHATRESTPVRPEHFIDSNPEPFVDTIREKVRDAKKLKEDEEPQMPARTPARPPMRRPEEKTDTTPYPPSILHALASHIEGERKTKSESHIHPDDPETDLQDIENNKEHDLKSKEAEKYRARIDEIMKRKKELHDLLGK